MVPFYAQVMFVHEVLIQMTLVVTRIRTQVTLMDRFTFPLHTRCASGTMTSNATLSIDRVVMVALGTIFAVFILKNLSFISLNRLVMRFSQ